MGSRFSPTSYTNGHDASQSEKHLHSYADGHFGRKGTTWNNDLQAFREKYFFDKQSMSDET